MSKHIVIIMAVMLVAGAGFAAPQPAPQATYATEAELLSLPGSAGYLEGGEFTAGSDAATPLCDCEGEGDDWEGDAEPPPDDGGDGGDGGEDGDDGGPETDEGETGDDVGC